MRRVPRAPVRGRSVGRSVARLTHRRGTDTSSQNTNQSATSHRTERARTGERGLEGLTERGQPRGVSGAGLTERGCWPGFRHRLTARDGNPCIVSRRVGQATWAEEARPRRPTRPARQPRVARPAMLVSSVHRRPSSANDLTQREMAIGGDFAAKTGSGRPGQG